MKTKKAQSPLKVATSSSILALSLAAASPVMADDHSEAQSTASASGHKSRPAMSAKDLITMPRLGSPIVSPDEKYAIYRVTETNDETLKRTPAYFLIDLTKPSAAPVPLDLGGTASSLSFGADGFLYFISDRDGASHLWRHQLNTRIYKNLTNMLNDGGVDGFKLAPTGDAIAIWARTSRECDNLGCGEGPEQAEGSGRLYDGQDGFVRHWDSWTTPNTYNRIFTFGLDALGLKGGAPADGWKLKGNAPTMPFGGGEEIAWSADGKTLFFALRKTGADEPFSTNTDIYSHTFAVTPGKGNPASEPTNLTENNKAYDTAPTPSPDGKTLAYLAMKRAGYESDRLSIYLRDIESGKTRELTPDFDRSFGSLSWTKDGQSLLATAADVLDTPVFKIDAKSGAIQKLDLMAGYEAHIGNVTPLTGGDILFTRDSIGAPHELFLSKAGAQAKPLTDAAMSHLDSRAATVTTRFSFAGAEGAEVWGQITKLEKHDGKMPAILYIHGGPQGSFRDGWSSRWNPRVLASQGYAVISVDFHGSTGYGQDFTDSINQDWGGKPLEDLQKGLAAALASDSQIDGTRACAMGASYGGYMVNWIAGKWPNRFKCLIQHDGLFDMRSFYYATEELWFPRWDFGGSYAEVPENYEKWNPVNHVDKWQTPMLVITGEKDFRVPYTQGIQSFTALQERDIPSQLLVFPDENHWVLGAKNSLQWHNTVFDWLDRWLVQDGKKVSKAQ